VTVELHDVGGRRVLARTLEPQRALSEEYLWLGELAPGAYRLAIRGEGSVSSGLVLRLR